MSDPDPGSTDRGSSLSGTTRIPPPGSVPLTPPAPPASPSPTSPPASPPTTGPGAPPPPGPPTPVTSAPAGPRDTLGRPRHLPTTDIHRRPSGELPPLPRHFSRLTVTVLVVAAGCAYLWLLIGGNPVTARAVSTAEGQFVVWVSEQRTAGLTDVLERIYESLYAWAVPVLGWAIVLALLVARRWRHLIVFFGSLLVASVLVVFLQHLITRPRPYGVTIVGPWEGWSQPSTFLSLASILVTGAVLALVPRGRGRVVGPVVAVAFLLFLAFCETYLGLTHPTDQATGMLVGVTVGLLAFRLFAPEEVFPVTYRRGNAAHLDVTGARGEAIRHAVEDQLGYVVIDIAPVGLAGSAGSTPLRLRVADPATGQPVGALFAKLLARSHLRSDRFYKLFRTLRYGRLEDENKFVSVRRLVQQEDYLALRMAAAGIRVPRSYGIVEITPEREYLVVTEFLDGFVEVGDAPQVDVELIDNALGVVRRMWDAGLAHRDVKPSNVMVRGSEVALIDVAFGQVRPSPWRQAVDLANMMLVLALRSDPALVYQRACLQFSPDEIAEAFAASRGMTLPSQVRHELKRDSRDLLTIFRQLAPARTPIPIQRWSLRRVGLMLWVVLVAVVVAMVSLSYLSAVGMLP